MKLTDQQKITMALHFQREMRKIRPHFTVWIDADKLYARDLLIGAPEYLPWRALLVYAQPQTETIQ